MIVIELNVFPQQLTEIVMTTKHRKSIMPTVARRLNDPENTPDSEVLDSCVHFY